MKTRARPANATSSQDTPAVTKAALPPEDIDPPRYFVLPTSLSKDAEIVTLAHPRLLTPSRYYFCPETGIYEFKRIEATPSSYRSWLVVPERRDDGSDIEKAEGDGDAAGESGCSIEKGYVSKIAELFVATPIDPLFLILPALSPTSSTSRSDATASLFLSADDLFEKLSDVSKHFRHVVNSGKTQRAFEERLKVVCDIVDAGEEQMYRLNNDKLLAELIDKARNMASSGLPPSMEEKFVRRALHAPAMVRQQVNSTSEVAQDGEKKDKLEQPAQFADSTSEPPSENSSSMESQATTVSQTTDTQATTDTAVTIPDPPLEARPSPEFLVASETPPEITNLLRLRVATSVLLSTYVLPHLSTTLSDLLALPSSPIDFNPLDAHLAELAKLRAEAAALQSLATHGRKRTLEEDEAAGQEMAEKRRKKEEEEKKKKAENRSIKDLRKVDTSGMKKMSEFFKKKAG